jgi:hypothetical protein
VRQERRREKINRYICIIKKETVMGKYYQPIDGKNIAFDSNTIAEVFGAAGDVIASRSVTLGLGMDKYAFYNTGELCEVRIEDNSPAMYVTCYGNRGYGVLEWLKRYLTNGMRAYGWETDFTDGEDYFFAHFYQKEE